MSEDKKNGSAQQTELNEEQLSQVTGGFFKKAKKCPNAKCQSTRNPIKKGREIVCPDCGYSYGQIIQNETLV